MRLALLALLAACKVTGSYSCEQDSQCIRAGATGRCEATHSCSFSDGACDSGYRYDSSAGSLANQCVAALPADAPIDAVDAPPDVTPPLDASPAIMRVNLGGNDYIGTEYLGLWKGDPNGTMTCSSGTPYTGPSNISGTVDDPLFQTRLFTSNQILSCKISGVAAGNYRMRLLFAESDCGCISACTTAFRVKIEGNVVGNVDVYTEVGCNAALAHSYDFTHGGTDIQLALEPMTSSTIVTLSALEVIALP